MRMAGQGRSAREGTRMGLWGAAQAIAFGFGGLIGAAASDLTRWLIGSPGQAYAAVFLAEAVLFVFAARLAARLDVAPRRVGAATGAATGAGADPGPPAIVPMNAR